ncbi:YkuS family protein [Crassaminicella thermophila]|uniref:YkuS family protein n=1 Tax=Crassaminicella thermophila TaxID=2599308 RepID=UPI00143D4030|nr:YkuS family protein [Crassaminicella thermophila]
MPRIVAIQDNLKNIGKELEARGYEVVHEDYDGYVDAILYDSDCSRLSYLHNFDNVIDMNRGAIVIDVKNKEINKIIYALENRAYESLF